MGDLLTITPSGLFCEAGGFYVDPWRAVDRAVVTHAHSDHARRGSAAYLCAEDGMGLLRARLGDIDVEMVPYGERVVMNGVSLSLHPSGHVLGAAQLRIERGGEVWVVTGDYKTDPDPTCRPFELVRCDTLITECTFGLPLYRWPDPDYVFRSLNGWWRRNREMGRLSVLYAYSLGKAQRVLAGSDPAIGRIYVHEAVGRINKVYRHEGVDLPGTLPLHEGDGPLPPGSMVITPRRDASRLNELGDVSTGSASGWMRLRRRRRTVDRGFILSDHVDWPQLVNVVRASGAHRILATHGFAATVARFFAEEGLETDVLPARYRDESPAGAEADVDRRGDDATASRTPPS